MMVFSTDRFMTKIGDCLNQIATDFIGDMADDANIVARRLIDETDDKKALVHMNEISTLAEMCTNMKHDCEALENAFAGMFRREHGSGKEAATGLDAMRIITEISNDINKIKSISYPFLLQLYKIALVKNILAQKGLERKL